MRNNALSLLILITGFSIISDASWTLKKSDDGIVIYTKSNSGSDIKSVLVIDTVKSTLSAITAILLDTKNYPSWIFHCSDSKTLTLINGQELYKYLKMSVPWPFDDRDLVTHFKVVQDSITKVVTLTTTSAPDYIPEDDGVVRIRNYQSVYTLTPMPHGYVAIALEFYADPGGAVPGWLVNSNIVTGPYSTAFEMRKKLPQYQAAQYPFIKEKI